ncbi:MAG: ABC transporter permease subunit [Anaerolineae bacterium]|jgi:ABC-type transport system involved in multi-copper enzyme maturation permease subunit|nr:MAG: ABC transporter permease subunit [Anaerolineae bacterium]
MIGSLFRAEWKKVTGNRWLVGCLIWIWPLGALSVALGLLLLGILSDDIHQRMIDNPARWTDSSLLFWTIPNSIIGRLIIICFATVLFAGEYRWGTWKNLLPRQGRLTLIVMKFITLAVFIMLVFVLTSLVWVLARGVVQLSVGGAYPPALDEIPSNYWRRLVLQLITAFLSTLIIAGIAALIALVTRSIIAGVVVGLGAAVIDGVIGAALLIFYAASGLRFFPSLFRFTITYNVDNLLNWALSQESSPVLSNIDIQNNEIFGNLKLDPPLAGNSMPVSLLILVLWMLLLVGLAAYSFYRQDITE